jgi:hypothetical protein
METPRSATRRRRRWRRARPLDDGDDVRLAAADHDVVAMEAAVTSLVASREAGPI